MRAADRTSLTLGRLQGFSEMFQLSQVTKDWLQAAAWLAWYPHVKPDDFAAPQPNLSILAGASSAAALAVDARLRLGSLGFVAVAAGSYFHVPGVDRRLAPQHLAPGLRQ